MYLIEEILSLAMANYDCKVRDNFKKQWDWIKWPTFQVLVRPKLTYTMLTFVGKWFTGSQSLTAQWNSKFKKYSLINQRLLLYSLTFLNAFMYQKYGKSIEI